MPPHRIVLELLEDISPDDEVLSAVRRMKEIGFTIALDDYVYRRELDDLVGLADIVKVDLPLTPRERLTSDVRRLRDRGVMVLAEKVETPDEYELCRDAGCELFQGYFFANRRRLPMPESTTTPSQLSTCYGSCKTQERIRMKLSEFCEWMQICVTRSSGLPIQRKFRAWQRSNRFATRLR